MSTNSISIIPVSRDCSVSFEGQNSWIGPFREASQKPLGERFKYVEEICGICRDQFLPEDQIMVLPCTHGLHEHCFRPWGQQYCPYDHTPAEGINKVNFLGYSLLFPPNTRKFGTWLSTHKNNINDYIQLFLRNVANEDVTLQHLDSDLWEKEEYRVRGKIIESFLQGCLEVYGGALPQRTEENATTLLGRLLGEVENSISAKELATRIGHQWNIRERIAESGDLIGVIPFMIGMIKIRSGLSIDNDGIGRLTSYLQLLYQGVRQSRYLKDILEELDIQFLNYHKVEFEKLTCDEERHDYLSKLDQPARERLNQCSNGEGPFSPTYSSTLLEQRFFKKHFKAIKDLPTTLLVNSYLSKMDNEELEKLKRLSAAEGRTSQNIRYRVTTIITRRNRMDSTLFYTFIPVHAAGVASCGVTKYLLEYIWISLFPPQPKTEWEKLFDTSNNRFRISDYIFFIQLLFVFFTIEGMKEKVRRKLD